MSIVVWQSALDVCCAQNAKASIPYGSRGFLISCVGGKEQLAAREATHLLTEVRQGCLMLLKA